MLSLCAIAKESGSHYLIPLFITTGLNLVFLFQVCRNVSVSKLRKTAGFIALISLLAVGAKGFVEQTPETYSDLREQREDLIRLYRHAQEIAKNDVRVDYFFSDSPLFPLCYGNDYAGGAFGQLLARIYPDTLFFNVFNSKFETFTTFINPEDEIQKYDHLYFLGSRKLFPKVKGLDPDTFETIDQAGDFYLQKWTRKNPTTGGHE